MERSKKSQKNSRFSRVNKKHSIWLAITFLVVGFIFAFSYRTLGVKENAYTYQPLALMQEERYRNDLIEQQEKNRLLRDEVQTKTDQLHAKEMKLSQGETSYESLAERARTLRLLLGEVPAEGEGVRVTLHDSAYDPATQNPNDYIVHESHVLSVVNELKIAGAEGIAVNGQRLHANSYIKCTGPVITVDGQTFPEPFIIEAVGEPGTLKAAFELKGGVKDWLKGDNIIVELEERLIELPEVHKEGVDVS